MGVRGRGGRAASAALVWRRGLLRGMGSFVRRACGLLWGGNAREVSRIGARCAVCSASGLLGRRLYSDGFYCAAWVHLSDGLAACFGVGMRGAFVDERAMHGLPGGRAALAALVWRRGLLRAAWGHLSSGFAACFGAGMRRAFVDGRAMRGSPGGRAASGSACRAAGFTARHGPFVRRACGLLWGGNARWARMGARFVRFAGLCADAAGGLLRRRLYGGGVYCAAWAICPAGLRKSENCRTFFVNSDCICVVVML